MIKYPVTCFTILFVLCVFPPESPGRTLITHSADPTETGRSRQFSISGGWTHLGLRDMGISPLYYSGSHVLAGAGYRSQSQKVMNHLDLTFMAGSLFPAIYPDLASSRMESIKTSASYSRLWFTGKSSNQKLGWHLGGRWNTQFAHYRHNQFVNSEINQYFIGTIGASGMLTYPVSGNERKHLMIFQIHLPLAAAIVRNSYAYIKPAGFLEHENSRLQSILNSIEYASPKNFFNLETDFSFEYSMRNNNRLRIGYRWEYMGHRNYNTLKSATHGIILQTMFNF
jgi:hypothetical protein